MGLAEVVIYGVLIAVVFLWGTGLIVRAIARPKRGRRLAGALWLLGWIAVPLILAIFALSAMMSPTGGSPVITILRLIVIGYLVGGTVVIMIVLEFTGKHN